LVLVVLFRLLKYLILFIAFYFLIFLEVWSDLKNKRFYSNKLKFNKVL